MVTCATVSPVYLQQATHKTPRARSGQVHVPGSAPIDSERKTFVGLTVYRKMVLDFTSGPIPARRFCQNLAAYFIEFVAPDTGPKSGSVGDLPAEGIQLAGPITPQAIRSMAIPAMSVSSAPWIMSAVLLPASS